MNENKIISDDLIDEMGDKLILTIKKQSQFLEEKINSKIKEVLNNIFPEMK
jgi:hypothetical protein